MSDSEKEWWLARRAALDSEHSAPGVAPHPRESCGDAERPWYPQMTVCHAEMEVEAAREQYRRLHEKRPWHDGTFTDWAAEPTADHPYHYLHGVRIWVAETDLGLGGRFTTRENPLEVRPEDEEDQHGDSSGEGDPRP